MMGGTRGVTAVAGVTISCVVAEGVVSVTEETEDEDSEVELPRPVSGVRAPGMG